MMDKAVLGYMRIGHFRIGVHRRDWDTILERFENVPAKTLGGISPCLQGSARQGQTRHRVYVPLFDELKQKMKDTV